MKEIFTPQFKKFLISAIILITVGLLIFFAFYQSESIKAFGRELFSIVLPFLIGAGIAFLLKPVCNYFDRVLGDWFVRGLYHKRILSGHQTERSVRKKATIWSIVIGMLIFFLIVVGLLLILIPTLVNGIQALINNITHYIINVDAWVASLTDESPFLLRMLARGYTAIKEWFNGVYGGSVESALIKILEYIQSGYQDLFSTATSVLSSIFSAVVGIFVALVSAFNILYNRKRFGHQARMIVHSAFKPKVAEWLIREAKTADRKFTDFFVGKLLDSVIVGVILFITLLIVGIPNAGLIAIFMAFCNMIPFFGPFIGAIPSALLVFMSDPTHPINILYFLIIVLVIQQLDGNILDPYIVGDNIGLSSFWVLFAVIVFGDLFGFVGMLVGVPIFAILYDLIQQLVTWGLHRQGQEQMLTDYNFIYHNPEEERGARRQRVAAIKAARRQARENDAAERLEAERCALAIAEAEEQERREREELLRRAEEAKQADGEKSE